MSKETYKSRVYTDRPAHADFDAPAKFNAIQSIIARRLTEHPNAIYSYSGGADSDIMIDVIERTREIFSLPPIKYVLFNTGLEMKAIKDHVREVAGINYVLSLTRTKGYAAVDLLTQAVSLCVGLWYGPAPGAWAKGQSAAV